MGEIADALRKANAEREAERGRERPDASTSAVPTPPVPPRPAPPAREDWGYAESLTRGDEVAKEAPPPVRQRASEPAAPDLRVTEGNADEVADEAVGALHRHTPNAELCRHLALRIRERLDQMQVSSLAIVSPLRNDGKTTVACNLALALASLSPGRDTAIVDLDLRNPSVARRLGLHVDRGVEGVLKGAHKLEDVGRYVPHLNLDVYPALEPQASAHEILIGDRMHALVRELEQRYTTVVFDTPPTLLVPDSTLLLKSAGACVAVAHAGQTRLRSFRSMVEMLPPRKLIGKVLNGTSLPRHQRDYYYYGYGHTAGESAS